MKHSEVSRYAVTFSLITLVGDSMNLLSIFLCLPNEFQAHSERTLSGTIGIKVDIPVLRQELSTNERQSYVKIDEKDLESGYHRRDVTWDYIKTFWGIIFQGTLGIYIIIIT